MILPFGHPPMMSTTIKFDAGPTPARAQANSDGPRKKRKRAPAQGAADDCFTCLSRSVKCDRRRPYCSQCLDGGQDCAGYKTQLTWGVGVASRGKLRGLSLPVAGTSKASSDVPASNTTSKPRKKVATHPHEAASKDSTSNASSSPKPTRSDGATFKVSLPPKHALHDQSHLGSQHPRPSAAREGQHNYAQQESQTGPAQISLNIYNPSQHVSPVVTTLPHGNSVPVAFSAPHQMTPATYPATSTNHYFHHVPQQQSLSPSSSTHEYSISPELPLPGHTNFQQLPSSQFPDQPGYPSHTLEYAQQPLMTEHVTLSLGQSTTEDDIEEISRDFASEGSNSFSDALATSPYSLSLESNFLFPLSGTSTVGKTPRMQYLIQYYAEVIAPVLVAFDNPHNPLRNGILGLAARSDSLQHAISALSASNLRQRRESGAVSTGKTPGARRSSYMHLNLTNEAWDDLQNLSQKERKREETVHKYAAVRTLNQQLANPALRNDDSVLATLLILCLFHMCDSGIARFQTQFEGVKKLLSLRANRRDEGNGDDRWLTRFFTWFDHLAATVNDREGQLGSQYVELSTQSDGDWSHEALTGVDGELFKSISRLGRLNILSQGKVPESNPTIVSRPVPQMPSHKLDAQIEPGSFDSNGWMRVMADEDFFALKTASPDVQEQFWREWRQVRHDLQTWILNADRFDGKDQTHPYLTPEQRHDMLNISESFRYASLLYTERLADPRIPSSDPKIQGWVQQALYYIRQVRADVYLLWPLFIVGSECVHEEERSVIRNRCLDIQNDSGFMNNSSCLALIEKVWNSDGKTEWKDPNGTLIHTAFKFREVMLAEGNEGEWIVV